MYDCSCPLGLEVPLSKVQFKTSSDEDVTGVVLEALRAAVRAAQCMPAMLHHFDAA